MTDHDRQRAARTALAGDEDGAVSLLAQQLRAWAGCSDCGGEPMQERAQQLDMDNMPRMFCPTCRGLSLRERAYLAAYCGDRVAGLALGLAPCLTCGCWQRGQQIAVCNLCSTDRWVAGLSPYGEPVLLEAALAGARHMAQLMLLADQLEEAEVYLQDVERYSADPTGRNADTLRLHTDVLHLRLPLWCPVGPGSRYGNMQRITWASMSKPDAVRSAITERLVAWSLREVRG